MRSAALPYHGALSRQTELRGWKKSSEAMRLAYARKERAVATYRAAYKRRKNAKWHFIAQLITKRPVTPKDTPCSPR